MDKAKRRAVETFLHLRQGDGSLPLATTAPYEPTAAANAGRGWMTTAEPDHRRGEASGDGKGAASSAGSSDMSTPAADQHAARARAFREYVEPDIDVLLRVARTLTESWPEAEDVTQECLIRAWAAADRFDGAHPRTWLLTILRHTHLNMHRRRRPDTVEDVSLLAGARPAFQALSPPTPEEQVMTGILPEDLERAVASLDDKFRTVVLLIDVAGLTYGEAASTLGVPVGTVMSRLSRGRQRIRAHLRGHTAREGSSR